MILISFLLLASFFLFRGILSTAGINRRLEARLDCRVYYPGPVLHTVLLLSISLTLFGIRRPLERPLLLSAI